MSPNTRNTNSAVNSWRNFYIECAALFVTGVLMTGLVVFYVWAWRNRCPGCEICREYHEMDLDEQDDHVFEDAEFAYDAKAAIGKKD
jgi:hypothetical protein